MFRFVVVWTLLLWLLWLTTNALAGGSSNNNNMELWDREMLSSPFSRNERLSLARILQNGIDLGDDATLQQQPQQQHREEEEESPTILLNPNMDRRHQGQERLSSSSSFMDGLVQLVLPDTDNSSSQQYPRRHRRQDTDDNRQDIVMGNKIPVLRSTGTTIVGLAVPDDGDGNGGFVVLGADTRATDGSMVADKECHKIHCLVPNRVYACGAGTSGDLDALAHRIHYTLRLSQLLQETIGNDDDNDDDDKRVSSMATVCGMLKNVLYETGGGLGVNLIVGGFANESTPRLVALHPHGSLDLVPYAALGSGGLAAMAVLESRYYSPHSGGGGGMTLPQAKQLVLDAVAAGIRNDLGSGNHANLCILQPNGQMEMLEKVPIDLAAATDDDNDDNHHGGFHMDDDESDLSTTGVNGFGNIPYREQSRREIWMANDQPSLSTWDNLLLGLDPE